MADSGRGAGGARPSYFRQISLKSPLNCLIFTKKSWGQTLKTPGAPFFLDPGSATANHTP